MANFIERAQLLAATSAEIARLKGSDLEAKLLGQSRARLVPTGYETWNGGIDIYALLLEVPVAMYAAVEDQRDPLEKSILGRVRQLIRADSGSSIAEVIISPLLVDHSYVQSSPHGDLPAARQNGEPTAIPSFWEPGHFRLFVSHASEKKDSAHRLKEALAAFHVAAFVAHDDIEPTREWQAEIEAALRTMDALVALVSPVFRGSQWCDQEVGTALGRSKLVIPLRVGADPHGFMGKLQGLQTKGLDAASVAERVVEILVDHDASTERMTAALVEGLAVSKSWASSRRLTSMLCRTRRLTTAQAGRLLEVIGSNAEVSGAYGVSEQIETLIARVAPSGP